MPSFLENLKKLLCILQIVHQNLLTNATMSCPPGGFGAATRVMCSKCTKKYCNAAKGCQNELENTSHKTTSGMREWI